MNDIDGLPRLPPTSALFIISYRGYEFVCLVLWVCGFVGLWICIVVFVGSRVCACVYVHAC